MTDSIKNIKQYTRKDFVSDQEVKWCAGCGDFSVLSAVQNALPEMGVNKEDFVFVSGIGCSSRFPYYVDTYGVHGLHGRAAAIASGVKVANPKLSVWMMTGDGDSMAIGGNHFIHILRRNIDVNIVLFNNRIYGLTKGQYSPTTPLGHVTKTSPYGTIEHPFKPGELAMGAEGTFFARAVDTNPKMMKEIFIEAEKHKGTSLVEVLQNCVIFNNKTHQEITAKDVRDDHQVYLKDGEKMIFGKEKNKGLVLDGLKIKAITIGEDGYTMDDVLVHDMHDSDPTMAYLLARMSLPELPVAMGVIRAYKTVVYDVALEEQIAHVKANSKIKNMSDLVNSGNTFDL
ncbi:MAG: 2-oxoacid:ferredoxin oxidoreductase subunit beta [Bacteroidetes bacterium]|nr:MAG: 2-oxoacid:ferredoxin oxidoreductase subunit beta [Bacteroidota bacterium]